MGKEPFLQCMCRKFSNAFSSDAHAPQESKILDNSAILRIAFGPTAPQAAISTLAGLYYMDPFVEGDLPSMPTEPFIIFSMQSPFPNGNAALRIAFGPAGPQAAISTLAGLYYMDPFVEGVLHSTPFKSLCLSVISFCEWCHSQGCVCSLYIPVAGQVTFSLE